MNENSDNARRRFLTLATTVVGGVGCGITAWPFIDSWNPSAQALAAGQPETVDLSKIRLREQITVTWRRKPVWILRRDKKMLDSLTKDSRALRDPNSKETSQQPNYARNVHRSSRPEFLVAVALCTHLGCVPSFRPEAGDPQIGANWRGGYYCPCHGSRFDFAGRVFAGVPAPTNLLIPPYRFLNDKTIEIGVDQT